MQSLCQGKGQRSHKAKNRRKHFRGEIGRAISNLVAVLVSDGAIQAIFLQLSWSQHKLAHSCQGRGQRSNGAINRNKHLFRSFCRGILNVVTPSLTVAELFQKEGMK